MPGLNDEEIKVRVPAAMKRLVKARAKEDLTSESTIVRQALDLFFRGDQGGAELREDGNAKTVPPAPGKPVSYKRRR